MKAIIEINGTKFLSPDAVTAAKVADLLGQMKPIKSKFWHQDFTRHDYAHFFTGGKCHQVSIGQINEAEILANEAAADAFIKTMTDATPEIPQPEGVL